MLVMYVPVLNETLRSLYPLLYNNNSLKLPRVSYIRIHFNLVLKWPG